MTDSQSPHTYDIEEYMNVGQTSVGVVESVARALHEDPLELPPLHGVVDCDSLDRLFSRDRDRRLATNVSITISSERWTATIDAVGFITIRT